MAILGDGVAANCCAHLLNAAGLGVTVEKTNRPKVPALLIGNATQSLIEDVFERKDIFRGAQRISRRIVAWGVNTEPIEIPHSALVIHETHLAARLRPNVGLRPRESGAPHRDSTPTREGKETAEWTIFTSRSAPAQVTQRDFGSRVACAVPVQLKKNCARDACWIESLESGWLFLLPAPHDESTSRENVRQAVSFAEELFQQSPQRGWLLSVGGPAGELLSRSQIVSEQIESLDSPVGQFPAYPRVSDPLCGVGWLACGAAAMAFDPICGDGAGNAIREAILACAVIKAIEKAARNSSIDALLTHYRNRLLAGFLKHLELCRQFYAACSGDWWAMESALLDEGIAWCREQLSGDTKFRYRLRGFDLEPV